MNDLKKLQDMVVSFRNERDWQQFHNPKDSSISLVLEATELLEHFQWKSAEEMKKHVQDKKEDVGDELADVFYWVLLLAHDFDIDLSEQLGKKLEKNAAKYPVSKSKGKHTKYTEL
jgi:NTP pyrophosphatase (non-canonical NTP hydrolase)